MDNVHEMILDCISRDDYDAFVSLFKPHMVERPSLSEKMDLAKVKIAGGHEKSRKDKRNEILIAAVKSNDHRIMDLIMLSKADGVHRNISIMQSLFVHSLTNNPDSAHYLMDDLSIFIHANFRQHEEIWTLLKNLEVCDKDLAESVISEILLSNRSILTRSMYDHIYRSMHDPRLSDTPQVARCVARLLLDDKDTESSFTEKLPSILRNLSPVLFICARMERNADVMGQTDFMYPVL